MTKIKEKVLKKIGKICIKTEYQLCKIALNTYESEVGKVIDDYKEDMKVLKGDTGLTFEEHINNIKQKLGIKVLK